MMHIPTTVRGLFKIEAVNIHTGVRRELAPWQDNLITNGGLDGLGTGTPSPTRCHVGSGNTPPVNADTQLASWVAVNNSVSSTNGVQSTAPYFGWRRLVYRFNAGVATGNLSELGTGPADTNTNLFSRALIVDGLGNPTTITVLADEFLDVTYEFRQYPPLTDVVGDITIASVTYATVLRAAIVTDGIWGGTSVTMVARAFDRFNFGRGTDAYANVSSLGDITTGVSGVILTEASYVHFTYIPGTYFRDYEVTWAVNSSNHANGITGVQTSTSRGIYKIMFTPAIPKNNTNNLSLIFRMSWARHTP